MPFGPDYQLLKSIAGNPWRPDILREIAKTSKGKGKERDVNEHMPRRNMSSEKWEYERPEIHDNTDSNWTKDNEDSVDREEVASMEDMLKSMPLDASMDVDITPGSFQGMLDVRRKAITLYSSHADLPMVYDIPTSTDTHQAHSLNGGGGSQMIQYLPTSYPRDSVYEDTERCSTKRKRPSEDDSALPIYLQARNHLTLPRRCHTPNLQGPISSRKR